MRAADNGTFWYIGKHEVLVVFAGHYTVLFFLRKNEFRRQRSVEGGPTKGRPTARVLPRPPQSPAYTATTSCVCMYHKGSLSYCAERPCWLALLVTNLLWLALLVTNLLVTRVLYIYCTY